MTILVNCTPKVIKPVVPKDIPPQEIPGFAFSQLRNQKSFRFHLRFKTDTPALIEAEFKGNVVLPNQEERTGVWSRLGEKVTTHIKGIGDFQYERKDGKWERHPRGEESNILMQIERILLFSESELKSRKSRELVFGLKPNLVFLDPTQSKSMSGLLVINHSSRLPLKIQVFDSARTAFWEIRFYDYNRVRKLTSPFIPKIRIQLVAESKIAAKVKTQLIDRFQQIGRRIKIKALGNKIELQLEQAITETQLNLLISQGRVEIYTGDWLEPKNSVSDTGQIKYFQFRPVRLNQLILNNQAVERAEANSSQGPEPILELYLKAQSRVKLEGQNKLLFLIFDDEIIGYAQVQQNELIDRLQFKEVGDILKVTTIAAIINSGMIKQALKLLSKTEL